MATEASSALYRDRVLDHGRAPRGRGRLPDPAQRATAHNTLCGDRVELSLRLDAQGRIAMLRHDSEGCLLCLASASLMAEHLPGLDAETALGWGARLHAALVSGATDDLGGFDALAGVALHPARHRCVLLPWEALREALPEPRP